MASSNTGKQLLKDLFFYSPCDTPITYSIGTIDKGFNTTKEELLSDAKKAANVWNASQNKNLLSYDPNSSFTINLIYDDRQALTGQISELNRDLKERQEDIDPQITSLKNKQDVFQKKVNELNNNIEYWNKQGGAPKEEYDKLIETQNALRNEAILLKEEAQRLGQSTDQYNINVQRLNQTIDNYKQVLEIKPEEGLYEQNGNQKKISIFIDNSNDEFLHTLTHEFGHALGLNHVNDNNSIMYPKTTNILTLSREDEIALSNICKERSVIELTIQRIKELNKKVAERLKL